MLTDANILPGLYDQIKPNENPPFLLTLHVRARGQDSVKSLMTQAGYSLKMPKKANCHHLRQVKKLMGDTGLEAVTR